MKISVFGLGIIGRVWAENLLTDGHEVRGWNRTPKPELPWFEADAARAAHGAEFLIIVVADPPAVQSVLDQIKTALRPGQTIIQSSTISPLASKEFARQVEATGAAFLEAPFTGSKPAAQQRQTVFYTGGEPVTLEQARPVLARLSRAIEHIGPVGSASALKLAMNIQIAMMAQALCESLKFARDAGISDDRYFSALKLNVAHSGLTTLKEPKLRAADYAPQFSVKHMGKDIRLALENAANLKLPQTQAVFEQYRQGLATGLGDDDFIGLMRLLQ